MTESEPLKQHSMLVMVKLTKRQEAKLKAFCRLIDASIGEFTSYALESEMDFQLEGWRPTRIKQLENLAQSMMQKIAPDNITKRKK